MRIHGGAGEIAGKTALNLNLLTRSVDANRSKAMINDAIKDDCRPISSTMELRSDEEFPFLGRSRYREREGRRALILNLASGVNTRR